MGPGFESLKVHQADLAGVPDAVHQLERAEEGTRTWPVGQVVKTEASHAFNIGSNPVRVTISFLTKSGKLNILQFVTANHGFNSWC